MFTHWVILLMELPNYKLAITNDELTSKAGLICVAELMQAIKFKKLVNQHFPRPGSNRGFAPGAFVCPLVLMLHEGGRCLDDLSHLRSDHALRHMLGLGQIPRSDVVGDWLRRHGQAGVEAARKVNRHLLALGLNKCTAVTVDIDASFIASKNQEAKWSYLNRKGYMPMLGFIAQTGQVLTGELREGNVAPAYDNEGFISLCEASLPQGVSLQYLRIDAAGYQSSIIKDCLSRNIGFAIRAKMSGTIRNYIAQAGDEWQALIGRDGKVIEGASTYRTVHIMERVNKAFTLVIQRQRIAGQQFLDLDMGDETCASEEIYAGGYIYRAIATTRDDLSDSDLIHWYNQRGEAAENRIKELKSDFGAEQMPCGQFDANALYFAIITLAYNLYVLLRTCMPGDFESARAKAVRLRFYNIAGKVTRTARSLYLKLTHTAYQVISAVIDRIRLCFANAPPAAT